MVWTAVQFYDMFFYTVYCDMQCSLILYTVICTVVLGTLVLIYFVTFWYTFPVVLWYNMFFETVYCIIYCGAARLTVLFWYDFSLCYCDMICTLFCVRNSVLKGKSEKNSKSQIIYNYRVAKVTYCYTAITIIRNKLFCSLSSFPAITLVI